MVQNWLGTTAVDIDDRQEFEVDFLLALTCSLVRCLKEDESYIIIVQIF